MNKGSKQLRESLRVFVKFMRAAESVSNSVHKELQCHNLTISQFGVLEALLHLGPLCQRDLAEKILKSTGNITMVIGNLEKRGLVIRKRDAKDRRFYIIYLSKTGRGLIEGIFPDHALRIEKRLAALTPVELKEFGRLCRKLKGEGEL